MSNWLTRLAKAATVTASGNVPAGHSSWNAAGGPLVATLPALTGGGAVATLVAAGKTVRVKISKSKADLSNNLVTVTCAGGDTLEGGSSTYALVLAGEKITLSAEVLPGTSTPVWVVEEHTAPPSKANTASNQANTRRLMAKLYRNVSDASILVISDSTGANPGDGTQRWVRLWAPMIAAKFPKYTVVFHWWDDTTSVYDAAAAPVETVQTGTGSGKTATVTNAALTSNVVTLTTSAAHGYQAGEVVTVAGVGSPYNGTFTVATAPSSTTLTYALTNANITSAAAPGTVTAPRALHIWNFAVSGQTCSYALASRYAPGLASTAADCILVSHGKNEGYKDDLGIATTVQTGLSLKGRYLALTEDVTATFPDAGLLMVLQCPNSTFHNGYMAGTVSIQEDIAAKRGFGVVNVHDAFLATGAPDSYVRTDGIHPTSGHVTLDAGQPNGSLLWAYTVDAAFTLDPLAVPRSQQPSARTQTGKSLLTNTDFSAFTAAQPDGWTLTGCTASKDTRTGWFESANGYSVRLQATGAAQSKMSQSVNARPFAGKTVTLTVRYRAAAAQRSSASSARFGLSDGTNVVTSDGTAYAYDAMQTAVISLPVSPSAVSLNVTLYADSGAVSTADISVDSVDLVLGDLPRRAVIGTPGPAGPAGGSPVGPDFLSTVGGVGPVLALIGNVASMSSANQGIAVQMYAPRDITISGLDWFTGSTVSGNYDIAILDASGNRLWSKGSSAYPTANTKTRETVSPTVFIASGTKFYVELAVDNASALFRAPSESFTDQIKTITDGYVCVLMSSQVPIASTVAVGSAGRSGKWPIIIVHGT